MSTIEKKLEEQENINKYLLSAISLLLGAVYEGNSAAALNAINMLKNNENVKNWLREIKNG